MVTWAAGTFTKWTPESEPGNGEGGGQGKGQEQDGDEQGAGEGEGQGQGKGQGPGQEIDDEALTREIEKKLSNREEIGSDQEAAEAEEQRRAQSPKPGSKAGSPGKGGISDLESRKAEIDKIAPTIKWQSMIRLMVSSSVTAKDTTYAKPSKKSLTGITVAAQTGAGAMKPGEKEEEQQHNKLALVFDTSGSMYGTITIVLAEVRELLKRLARSSFPVIVIFFADGHKWFQINLANNSYQPISGVDEISKPFSKKTALPDYTRVTKSAGTGGTNFETNLVNSLSQMAGQGYNIMVFSDDDILSPTNNNVTNFIKLWSGHRKNVFAIFDSLETWRNACKIIDAKPNTFTYLPVPKND